MPRRSPPPPPLPLVAGLALVVLVSLGLAVVLFEQLYADRIYPGVAVASSIARTELGGLTREQAAQTLITQYDRYLKSPMTLRYGAREWQVAPRDLGARVDADQAVNDAYGVARSLPLVTRLRAQANVLSGGTTLPPPRLALDDGKLTAYLATLAKDVERPTATAEISLRGDGSVVLLPSQTGAKLNQAATARAIKSALASYSTVPVEVVVDDVPPALAEADLADLKRQAEKVLAQPLILEATVDGQTKRWTLDRPALAELVQIRPVSTSPPRYELGIDDERIRAQVEKIAPEIERAPKNARFALENGQLRVIRDSEEGRRLEVTASIDRIHAALLRDERHVQLTWQPVRAEFASEDIAKLQFPDLIEKASTVYGGTLPERMFNVELATQRVNGVVVGPGDSFSFNDEVGEVSYRSGYKKGYGISQDGDDVVTIPSEGGGICQVATTVFQSVFWAGYPIVERNWHLYWIPRYGAPPRGLKGLDATIDQVYDKDYKLLYAVDLRWRNNTEAPVLLVAQADGKNVTVQLWGRKPDWQVKVADPKIDKIVKADTRNVHQTDPTLPPGAEIMVEHAEDGFQSTIVRTILRDGKIFDEQRFVSTYRPSRNVFLDGPGKPAGPASRIEDHPATPVPATTGGPTSVITPLPTPDSPRPPATKPPAAVTPKPTPPPTGRG